MKKRLLSLALAVVMVCALLPRLALAAGSDFVIENGVLMDYKGTGGNVVIPDNVTRIGPQAFRKCTSLTGVTIPDGVTSIGEIAFGGCSGLKTVTIPDSVTTIGENAFASCTALTHITIPNGVTTIDQFAFSCCDNLIRIAIPKSVTTLDQAAFWGSYEYPNVYYGGSEADWEALKNGRGILTHAVIHYNSTMPSSAVPDAMEPTVLPKPISWSNSQMIARLPTPPKEIFTPSSEEESSYWQHLRVAGEPWESPKSIEETLEEIKALSQDLTKGKSSETEKAHAIFDWVANNISYGVPGKSQGNDSDALSTFYFREGQCGGYTNLANLMLAYAGLTAARITGYTKKTDIIPHGWSAVYADGKWLLFDATWNEWDISPDFHYHINMIEVPMGSVLVKMHNGEEYILGRESDCEHIMAEKIPGYHDYSDLIIPDGVTGIEENGFRYCPNVTTVTCPNGMAVIRSYAFFVSPNLTRVVLPESLEVVEDGAFCECQSLREIQVAPDNPSFLSVDGVLFTRSGTLVACPDAKEGVYVVPEGTTAIAGEAFRGCKKLTDIVLPDGLVSLGSAAFWGFEGNITVPDSVDYIKADVFSQAGGHIYFKGTREQWDTIAPGVVDINQTLTIHCNSSGPTVGSQASSSTAATAYASTQSVLVDGSPVEFQAYALKDKNGNPTNYVKLRDIASVLNGTSAQFNVGWDGAVNIETGKDYTANGSEMKTPFRGDRAYESATAATNVNGAPAALDAIVLKDDAGGAYTYYKLRDLGTALGFRVDWSGEKGIFIETK